MNIKKQTELSEEKIILLLLKELDQTERNILGLYFYEKLSVTTISELINMPEDSIQLHLSGIMDKIKGEINKERTSYVPETEKKVKQKWDNGQKAIQHFPFHDR